MPALPEDEYLADLERVVYMLNGLEWLVIEVIRRLDTSTEVGLLAGMTSSGIAEQLSSKIKNSVGLSPEQVTALQQLAGDYSRLPEIRNDVVHARPATMPDGKQRLYRWAPSKAIFTGWIDLAFLAALCERATGLEHRFTATRAWFRLCLTDTLETAVCASQDHPQWADDGPELWKYSHMTSSISVLR